jgi:hypothetical protein
VSRLLPAFDLQKIRPHGGSQHHGFEELCTQLLSLEPRPASASFFRKGGSADAGVEAYIAFDSGDQHCLQAKFYSQFTSDLASKLTASLTQALDNHPGLVKYIVCLPFNLRDPRQGSSATELDRWRAWTDKAQREARARSRVLEIELWDASAIHVKLTSSDGRYAGRLKYWLDQEVFSESWFAKRWQESKAVLGERYIPHFNVETPARQLIDALVRGSEFYVRLEGLAGQALELVTSVRGSLARAAKAAPAMQPPATDLLAPVVTLCGTLRPRDVNIEGIYCVEAWRNAATDAQQSVRDLLSWSWEMASKSDDDNWRSVSSYTYRLIDLLSDIAQELASDKWSAANRKALFLTGPGGSGKSHLLGDAVQSLLESKRPAVLVPSSVLGATPIGWLGVAERLGRGASLTVDELLGALDAAGQAAETRALLAIDAINEGPARHWWPEQLAEFLVEAQRYPYVSVVLTCRDTFVERMVTPSAAGTLTSHWAFGVVKGFEDSTGELARRYLNMRGVTGWLGVRPGPESTNPLFLRTCCDAVLAAGGNELPRGLEGITAMFSFYTKEVASSVARKLGVVPKLRIVESFVADFAERVAASVDRYVRYEDAYHLAEANFASGGLADKNLLTALEAEGLLAVEPGVGADPNCDYVRFTFERMSDHAIAKAILRKHFERHTLADAFTAGTPLGDALRSTDWGMISVIQALAIQIAEEHGAELGDIVPARYAPGIWGGRENFLDTVHWRSARSVTQRTLHWIEDAVDSDGLSGFYIEFGPQVGNAFNADWLHKRLAGLTMPERDVSWSVTVNRLGFDEGGAIQTVVDWALASGRRITDPEHVDLLCTTLTWLLTTSHREVRDKATKALACVLAGSASASLRLLEKFKTVDDGYLQERLYAAVYGAALQASWSAAECKPIAKFMLKEFFETGTTAHVLTRDYARGIVEIAVRVGAISEDHAKAARPPYQHDWTVDLVPEEALADFVWPPNTNVDDDVVSSCLHDDFEHYTIPFRTQSFGCSPRTASSAISNFQLATLWREHFDSWADAEAINQLEELLNARRDLALADKSDWTGRTFLEEAAIRSLERFKTKVGVLVAENFRVCTSSGNLLVPEAAYIDGIARFDRLWAAKWVAKRAHDLGWSAERFEAAERAFRPTRDRTDHRIERLGKKYQWLALHELIGRLSDSVQLLPGWAQDEAKPYQGPWQVNARDIDPSMLRRSTKDDGWKAWPSTWWSPKQAKLLCRTPREAIQWLTSDVDVINDERLIDLVDIEGRRWLSLHGARSWNRVGKRQHPHEVTRKSWVHLHCLIVRPEDEETLVAALTKSKAENHPDLPDGEGYSEAFLGEFGWHPSAKVLDDWHAASEWGHRLPQLLVPTVQYSHSKGYDYSTDGNCSFRMPGAWLSAGLGLRLSNGADLTWTDGKRMTFFDPAVTQDGPSAALVDRNAFLSFVRREGLRAVWVLYGEKELYGPDVGGDAFGGRLHHLGVYRPDGADGWKIEKHRWHLKPNASQLAAFMKCC